MMALPVPQVPVLEPVRVSWAALTRSAQHGHRAATAVPSSGTTDHEQLASSLKQAFMGPGSLGMLAIESVPTLSTLRSQLMPMLSELHRTTESTTFAHAGMGTDVPRKHVSSRPRVAAFADAGPAALPNTVAATFLARHQASDAVPTPLADDLTAAGIECVLADCEACAATAEASEAAETANAHELRSLTRALAHVFVAACIMVARACDQLLLTDDEAAESDSPCEHPMGRGRLESALVSACVSKARAIRYSAAVETGAASAVDVSGAALVDGDVDGVMTRLSTWQGWHYDYGLFTALTAPRYTDVRTGETVSLEALPDAGLVCLPHAAESGPCFVRMREDVLLVQVGEAACLISGGRLMATPHAVSRCVHPHYARSMFVVFTQPAWETPLHGFCEWHCARNAAGATGAAPTAACTCTSSSVATTWAPFISRTIPPLHDRLREAEALAARKCTSTSVPATFSTFSTATTRAYYGHGGRQAHK